MHTEKFAHIVWYTKDHTEILEPAVTHTETMYKDVTTETEQIVGQKGA